MGDTIEAHGGVLVRSEEVEGGGQGIGRREEGVV